MGEASDARSSRRQARSAWPIRAYQLGDEPSADLRGSTTPSERLAMMWELARQSWSLSGRPFPEYRRSEIPGRIARLAE